MSFNFGGQTSASASAPVAGGFSFGGAPTAAVAPNVAGTAAPTGAGGFSFSAPKPATTSTGFTLGAPPAAAGAAPTTGFGFGATTTSGAASTGFSLGAPKSTAAPGLTFGTPAATSAPTLQLGGAPAASTATGFAGFGGLGGTVASTAPTLGFGATTASTAAPTLGFGAGATLSATATLGLGSSVAPATATPSGLGGQSAASLPTLPSVAVASSGAQVTTTPLAPSDAHKTDSSHPKDAKIPNELMSTVEEFKRFVKEERSIGSEIAHSGSSRHHDRVRTDIDELNALARQLSAAVARSKAKLQRLKMATAQEVLNTEVAQRTRDTPPALQYENTAPQEYFETLIKGFEGQMIHYRSQIEETERSLQAMAARGSSPRETTEEVMQAITKLQGIFTNLAGRYHKIHEHVQGQKETFLRLNRHAYGPEVFSDGKGKASPKSHSLVHHGQGLKDPYVGPSPFSVAQDPLSLAKANLAARPGAVPVAGGPGMLGQTQSSFLGHPATGNQSAFGGGALGMAQPQQSGLLGTSMSPFGGASSTFTGSGGAFGNTGSPFGAASPQQTGLKRGKH